MSTFANWYKAYGDGKGIRQITYVCGTEPVLIDEVVHRVQSELATPWNTVTLVATPSSNRDIWEQLDRRPMANENALTLVFHAQHLTQHTRLLLWWKNRRFNPNHYLILVSDEEAAPRVPLGDPKDHKTQIVDYLRFSGAGWVVECKPFTQATASTATRWVRSIAPMTDQVAGHLLNRADGDLRLVRDGAQKLRVFPGTITQSVVNDLFTAVPRDSFVDSLLAMDKRTALAALERIPKEEFSRTLGQLDSSLELAGVVHDFQLNNRPRYELIKAAGKRAWLLPEIEKVSKHYDLKRRDRIRTLLLMADEVLLRGETVGVLEAVTALW